MTGLFHPALCMLFVSVALSCCVGCTGYVSDARGLPLRLLSTDIDVIDVDAFELHTQPGARSVENHTSFFGSRIIFRFNRPVQDQVLVNATVASLLCAEDGHASAQTRVHSWTVTPVQSVSSVAFFATKRQFDDAIPPHLACAAHDDASNTATTIAATKSGPFSHIPSALRRVFHLVNAFGDLNRLPSALEAIVYIVNLRVGTTLERPVSRHSTDAAPFLHFDATVSSLWREEDARKRFTNGHASGMHIECTLWGAIPPAIDSTSLTSHNNVVHVAALSRPSVSFFFPTSCNHAPASANREQDVPTVELPRGACVFLEEEDIVNSGGGGDNAPPVSQARTFEPYAATTAAAISAAEKQMDAVDAERASAMANLVDRIKAQHGDGASREHAKVNVTAEVLRDASETIPRLLQVPGLTCF